MSWLEAKLNETGGASRKPGETQADYCRRKIAAYDARIAEREAKDKSTVLLREERNSLRMELRFYEADTPAKVETLYQEVTQEVEEDGKISVDTTSEYGWTDQEIAEARYAYKQLHGTFVGFSYKTLTGEPPEGYEASEPLLDLTKAIDDMKTELGLVETKATTVKDQQEEMIEAAKEIEITKKLVEDKMVEANEAQIEEIRKTVEDIKSIRDEIEDQMIVDDNGQIIIEQVVEDIGTAIPDVVIPDVDLGLPSGMDLKIGGAILVLIVLGVAVIAVAT